MIAGGFGSNKPAFLIGLLGEIPELVKGTDNAVEDGIGAMLLSLELGKVDRAGEP